MSFGRSLVIGLILGAVVAGVFASAMPGTNNHGEFADPATGRWSIYAWLILLGTAGVTAAATTLVLTIAGFVLGHAKDEYD